MVHVNHKGTIVFFEFHHKVDSILAAHKLGFKALLLAKNPSDKAKDIFDEVIITDWQKSGELKSIAGLLKKRGDVKAVITNYEHFVVQRTYLAQLLNLPSSDIAAAAATRNKALQRMVLSGLSENIESVLVDNLASLHDAFAKLGSDVFLKAIAGIKSRHVFHVKTLDDIDEAWYKFKDSVEADSLDGDLYDDFSYLDMDFNYPDPNTNMLVEKAYYGRQIAASAIVLKEGVWHAPSYSDIYTASDIGRDDSFLAFRILPSRDEEGVLSKVNSLVEKIVTKFKLKNCAFFGDFMITPQGDLKVIEFASRIGGYRPMMYREVYGFDLTEILIRSLTEQTLEDTYKVGQYVSLCEFFPKSNGSFVEINNLDELRNDKSVLYFQLKGHPNKEVGLACDGYEPVAVALLSGDTYDEVYNKSLYYHENLKVIVK